MNQSWVVAQLGARMHYAVPRLLAERGQLERFFTDGCATSGLPSYLSRLPPSLLPGPLRRLAARMPYGVPPDRITSFTLFGIDYARRRSRAGTGSALTETFLWAGKSFCRRVLNHGLGNASGVYCFNSAALELLQHARRQGRTAVVEQTIAPKKIELELLAREHAKFPGWEPHPGADRFASEFVEREFAEWQSADRIVCGSEFVRESIGQCGGPVEKCSVVPYGFDLPFGTSPDLARNRKPHAGPLRVLTVGAVGLRKGSPYVLEVARQMQGSARFRMVGPINVGAESERQLRQYVELTGPVPRSEVCAHFLWADVFLLPSVCEGSATVTYEALACGLPVVCTPNTGSVVRHQVDGFVVPLGAITPLVAALHSLQSEKCRRDLGHNARQRAGEFSMGRYGGRLTSHLMLNTTSV